MVLRQHVELNPVIRGVLGFIDDDTQRRGFSCAAADNLEGLLCSRNLDAVAIIQVLMFVVL